MCFEAHARVIRRFVDHEISFVSHKYRCSQSVSLNSGVRDRCWPRWAHVVSATGPEKQKGP